MNVSRLVSAAVSTPGLVAVSSWTLRVKISNSTGDFASLLASTLFLPSFREHLHRLSKSQAWGQAWALELSFASQRYKSFKMSKRRSLRDRLRIDAFQRSWVISQPSIARSSVLSCSGWCFSLFSMWLTPFRAASTWTKQSSKFTRHWKPVRSRKKSLI